MDIGFIAAGFRLVWSNELDGNAVQTHRDHLSATMGVAAASVEVTCGDVRTQTLPPADDIDVVIGGPPCQGFSVAGKMDPADPRSGHVWYFLDIVSNLHPAAFVMENVAALAENSRWSHILQGLKDNAAAMGFNVKLFVLNSADFGVPETRKRMFLVGTKTGNPYEPLPPATRKVTVREALRALPPFGAPGNDSICNAIVTPAKSPVLRKSPYAGMLFNGQGRPINLEAPALTLPASMGGNRTPIIDQKALTTNAKPWVVGYHKKLMRGAPPAKSIPLHLRRLTVEESALIQGFPVGMKFAGSQCSKFRQIGNAVPPPLAQAVATMVMDVLTKSPRL